MNTTIRLVVSVAALACGAALVPAAEPTSGKVLVLANERTVEGDIHKLGDSFVVRRQTGEAIIPVAQALKLCADLNEAYEFVRARANLRDPDERLRLAQWCHLRNLKDQALAEVSAAAQLRPEHATTQRLLGHLKQDAGSPREAVAVEEPPPAATLPPVDLSMDALCAFSTKVQPVLMNACAGCHASGKGGAFKLMRAYSDSPPTSKAIQQNVAAVLAQVNLAQPHGSPLLTKAVSAHGAMAQAPLKGRQAPAYRLLEDWLRQTVATNPHLKPESAATVEAKPAVEAAMPRDDKAPASSFGEAQPAEPEPLDPFDPSIFNKQLHPQGDR